jgi:CubicO group peptidase (beta-lactamase class C family)
MRQAEKLRITLDGHVEAEFAPVRDAFVANFEQNEEVGAAVAVYHHGQLVVDLAGGTWARGSELKYCRKTLQPIFSATKGIIALAANMLADRGQLDLDAPVVDYWPEFAQAGKFWITIRCLLAHQSGVLGLDETISFEQLLDWDVVVEALAAQRPDWDGCASQGYHSMTYGFLVGEVIRRVTGMSIGRYVAQEIAGPLQADLFIGLPKAMQARVAPVQLPELNPQQLRLPDSGPYAARALNWISPALQPTDVNRPELQAAEVPAANGIANARSLARMFAATIGKVDGTRLLSLEAMNQARCEQWRGLDLVMGVQNAVGLGFLLPTEWCPLGGAGSFGTAGFGGSRGWAKPELELAFTYTPNVCSLGHFDPREAALSRAAVACAERAAPNL